MSIAPNTVVKGKVKNITKFGAFVDIDGEIGLLHISEISRGFVKDVSDHLKENDEVEVKVIGVDDNGKISLSMKDLEPQKAEGSEGEDKRTERPQKQFRDRDNRDNRGKRDFKDRDNRDNRGPRDFKDRDNRGPRDFKGKDNRRRDFKDRDNRGRNSEFDKERGFEDALSQFLKESDEKLKNFKAPKSGRGQIYNNSKKKKGN